MNKENDTPSNDAVKAVTYGSTIGAILGASESGNGDPVVVQQAAKQSTEFNYWSRFCCRISGRIFR